VLPDLTWLHIAAAQNIPAARGTAQPSAKVNGRRCHSLAFVEKDIEHIWIDIEPQLTPCKLVITYKKQPVQPQFGAVFTDCKKSPRVAGPVLTP
jgi:hypothetical protein